MKSLKRWFLLRGCFLFCWLFHKTYRYERVHLQNFQKARSLTKHRNYAIASWHNNCFAGILSHARHRICLMVSKSFDGEFVAYLARKLGMGAVRGSSSRGGKEALYELVEEVNRGWAAAFTVDGPKGPFKEVKSGVISLASKTGAPIQPVASVGERQWVLHKSWDQFRVPKPFSRVAVVYGEPIQVGPDLSEERLLDLKQQLHQVLEDLEEQASRYFHPTEKPAV